jgi:NAD(P)-dependent dehydrogenase (short-subunit alcohol dehydrogenase family)/acyl dehydratase/putative sterol carrier protein
MQANINVGGALHGEQDILFHNPIPIEGTLVTEGKILKMFDRGKDKGALVVIEAVTHDEQGQKLFTNRFTYFSRLDGGFGGETPPQEEVELPGRNPDFEEEQFPSANQPLFYRLSGDPFQLHVDPDFAKKVGFEKPIMHGLCTHGFACRAVIKHLFPREPERIKRFRTRFSRPLYPGEPIKTRIWKIVESQAFFQTINSKTGEVVIDRGIVEWESREEMKARDRRKGIRFDDRVAIVTGAGGGLGRIYALELAKRGAKVVVNDMGGDLDGLGGSRRPADRVVEEITGLGGEAVASHDSVATVEGGQAIVNKALEAFGRVDILINNAGILRDKTFPKMEAEDWRQVLSVHLDGAYHVTRPAFIKMRENGYGRIVMTVSAAGLFGNFGQVNYSAAKAGLVGLMNSLELEGEKYNIKVNAIAPVAVTRMTEGLMPAEIAEKAKPEFVAPMVLYLCSQKCPANGAILSAGMGHFSRVGLVMGPGALALDAGGVPTPEEIFKKQEIIASLDGAKEFHDTNTAVGPMLEAWSPKEEARGGDKGLTVKGIFERMPEAFQAEKAAGVAVVFQWKISGDQGGDWQVIIQDGQCEVKEGTHPSPSVTLKISGENFVKFITKQVSAVQAFTTGKIKIEGDMVKSQLVEKLFIF